MCMCGDLQNEYVEAGSKTLCISEEPYTYLNFEYYPDDYYSKYTGNINKGYYLCASGDYDARIRIHYCPICGGKLE